jgi:hypothetical protein
MDIEPAGDLRSGSPLHRSREDRVGSGIVRLRLVLLATSCYDERSKALQATAGSTRMRIEVDVSARRSESAASVNQRGIRESDNGHWVP